MFSFLYSQLHRTAFAFRSFEQVDFSFCIFLKHPSLKISVIAKYLSKFVKITDLQILNACISVQHRMRPAHIPDISPPNSTTVLSQYQTLENGINRGRQITISLRPSPKNSKPIELAYPIKVTIKRLLQFVIPAVARITPPQRHSFQYLRLLSPA